MLTKEVRARLPVGTSCHTIMTFRLATRPAAQALRVPKTPLVRTVTSLSKVAYTAKAESSGAGRNGDVKLREGGPLKFQLTLPKSLGGSGEGHNPEQFFGTYLY